MAANISSGSGVVLLYMLHRKKKRPLTGTVFVKKKWFERFLRQRGFLQSDDEHIDAT